MSEPPTSSSHADYPMAVAADSVARKSKRRKYSHHPCPSCKRETLERKRSSPLLRILRQFPGLNPRRYVCEVCGKRVIIWNPPKR